MLLFLKYQTHRWRCSVLQYHLVEVDLRNLSEIVILNIYPEKFCRKQNNRHTSPSSMIAGDFLIEKTIAGLSFLSLDDHGQVEKLSLQPI